MADFSFNEPFERRNTGNVKWDRSGDALPFWIADMDVRTPNCITQALHNRIEHGFFGYACMTEALLNAIVRYMATRHCAAIEASWILETPGCVPALSLVARAVCRPGDAMMTCTPVYPPIRNVHRDVGCDVIEVPHILADNVWQFDWDAMEKAVTPQTRLFVLCNPQNPLGRVWSQDEILRLARFCERHDLILCSDEIHCDLVLDETVRHFSAMALPEPLRQRCVTLSAPSKTYNIAGLGFTYSVIPNTNLRERIIATKGCTMSDVNCLAYTAAYAAYTEGEAWRQQLIVHLRHNRDFLCNYIRAHIPAIKLPHIQATYLAWMDCSALGLENPQEFFLNNAGIKLNPGADFGAPQHVRFNFGTTRDTLSCGLIAMAKALR